MEKTCGTCKYDSLGGSDFPCVECKDNYSKWEPLGAGDAVQHPSHYNHGKYECIEVMVENFGKEAVQHFCLLNAFKYVWRTNYKNGVEDVKKAMFYLDYYLKLEGEESVKYN